MKRKYMKPFTAVVVANYEDLLFGGWHSTKIDGTLPDGTEVGNGGDGEEDDIELSKSTNIWEDPFDSNYFDD